MTWQKENSKTMRKGGCLRIETRRCKMASKCTPQECRVWVAFKYLKMVSLLQVN
jgi:hypothetical protein